MVIELDAAELAPFAAARPVPEELSPLVSGGALVVHGAPADVDAGWLEGVPAVTVLVGNGEPAPDGFDVYLTTSADPPAPWVRSELATVTDAVAAQPLVCLAAVSLYRAAAGLDVWRGLAAESATYAALLASAPFQEWRARRPARPAPPASEPPVLVDRLGSCLRIVLNRPHVHNAVDSAMRDGLVEALAVAVADPAIDEVELAGAGASFSSGGDLEEFGTVGDPATAHAVRLTRHPARWLHLCADRVVVRAHGACLGAGVELASFAGRVVAAPDAYFGLPEVAMGLVPGAGGTVGIPRRIGRPRAAWLTLTGERLPPATARAWGLVDELEA
ncbi:MAG TPA: enoyl-CoA hydratase/isomerase family protein [Acidimicrobiales bacterium]|nr:enoyl-CoA hydratase/isomerase family protein [Acidimicrobiales bacterium]